MSLLFVFVFAAAAQAELMLPKISFSREEMARHLLNRAAFGPRPGEAASLAEPGKLESWLENQLKPGSADSALTKKLAALPSSGLSTPALLERYPNLAALLKRTGQKRDALEKKQFRREHKGELPANIIYELSLEKIVRAVESPRQLEEVLTDFWFNHFNVDVNKGLVKWYAPGYQRNAIRKHLYGHFKEMLLATARDPAMLFYLDNWQSVREGFSPPQGLKAFLGLEAAEKIPKGLNENYGRELLELHTLGVDGGYTQKDIISVARAFTGWTIGAPRKNGEFLFRPRPHDTADVMILGRTFRGSEGVRQGEKVIELLATHPSTARFLSRKLCQRFVSEPAPASCVERLTKRFQETEGDLTAVYRALFTSQEFWSREAVGAKVKRPFEFLVSALRSLGASVEAAPLSQGRNLVKVMDALGEPLYRCPPPTGYKDEARAWVNTGALVNRLKVAAGLAAGRLDGMSFDLPGFFTGGGDDEIGLVSRKILGHSLSASTRATMEEILSGGEADAEDWELKHAQRAQFLALLLGSPEFQKR